MSEPRPRNFELEANTEDIDGLRVYADWLQSVGDPRGELVSLEVHRREGFRSQRKALEEEIQARTQPYVDSWHAWAQARDLIDVHPKFKRGFVHAIEGPLPQLRGVLDELFERDPIQRLTLREVDDDDLQRVCATSPTWFARLHYLHITGRVGPLGAAALAEVSLAQVERLNLLGNRIEAEACAQLANLDAPALRALTLTANQIDAAGLASLLDCPTRGSWRELYLAQNPLTAAGLAQLAQASGLEQLEALYLCDVEAQFADFAVVLDSPRLAGLETLEISMAGASGPLHDRMRARWGRGLVLR
ncbi:hypothetical protein ENSA5_69540 [Enhygromyxa salina]|uniref:Leucine Rich repeats (2 copies) n=1 Tax=Enhygromyxa salina TaxID=215803 RepID=A0A2S9XAN9_9BACT|nr:hypothetical protein [Enhygromyxa salina]PRP89918.1 hypothetical protein ENSA5_69540 [Enhygromyxa salina]